MPLTPAVPTLKALAKRPSIKIVVFAIGFWYALFGSERTNISDVLHSILSCFDNIYSLFYRVCTGTLVVNLDTPWVVSFASSEIIYNADILCINRHTIF